MVAQARNLESPFSITDWSVRHRIDENWRREVRDCIRRADLTIVICGEHTHDAPGVAAEITIAREEGKPYFLLRGAEKEDLHQTTHGSQHRRNAQLDLGESKAADRGRRQLMCGESSNSLFQFTGETYGGSFKADLLEQYKLYVQSAENVSARRVASNRYLLTLNAALVALYGLQSAGFGQSYWTLLIPVMGIPVSLLWYLIIKSHADLNQVKFGLIHEFEQHLPAALYKHEWKLADEGRGKSYRAVTTIERWIPILFAALHIVLALVVILEIAGAWDLAA